MAWWPTRGARASPRPTPSARWPSGGSPTPRSEQGAPHRAAAALADGLRHGDTDLAWTRITLWRGLLAAALDQPPYEPVTQATVVAATDSPSTDLLAGWLAVRLRCPVTRARARTAAASSRSGSSAAAAPSTWCARDGSSRRCRSPASRCAGSPCPAAAIAECLADELRRLDPDEVYEDALVTGLRKCTVSRQTATEAIRAGKAPSVAEAERTAARLRRAARASGSSKMVEAQPMPGRADDPAAVKKAAVKGSTPRSKDRRS